MNLKKFIYVNVVVAGILLGFFPAGFSEVKRGEIISFPGVIEQVDPAFKFIVVNETKIVITPQTLIADRGRTAVKTSELKTRRWVRIDALQKQGTFVAQTIIILPPNGRAGK